MSEGKSLIQQASELAHQSLMRSFVLPLSDERSVGETGETFNIPMLPGLSEPLPTLRMRRFLLQHHSEYADEFPRLFKHHHEPCEGVFFGNSGHVIVEIGESTYEYTTLDELLKVWVSSGLLVLKWIDEAPKA